MQVFSLKLNVEIDVAALQAERDMLRTQSLLCNMLLRDTPTAIVTQFPNVMDLVKCDGAALLYGDRVWLLGTAPNEPQLREIARWLRASARRNGAAAPPSGFSTDSLVDAGFPGALALGDAVCGLVAAQVSTDGSGDDYLFWFRSNVEREVRWSGARHNPGEKDDPRRMDPRASFAAFLEVVRHRSLPWVDMELAAIRSLQAIFREQMQGRGGRRMSLDSVSDVQSNTESEFARLLDTATAPVFAVDTDGCISGWNAKMVQLTGLPLGQALGKPLVTDCVHADSRGAVSWMLSQALKGFETNSLEIRMKTFHSASNPQDMVNSTPSRRYQHDDDSTSASSSGSFVARSTVSPSRTATSSIILVINSFASRAASSGSDSEDEDGDGDTHQSNATRQRQQQQQQLGAGQQQSALKVVGVCFVGQDLTQQKAMEGQFTKVQGDYESIVHSAVSLIPPIFAVDDSGICAEWNRAMERVTGVSRSKALGTPLLGTLFGGKLLMKSDAKTRLMVALNRALVGVATEHEPLAFVDTHGQLVESLLTAQPRGNSDDGGSSGAGGGGGPRPSATGRTAAGFRPTGVFCFLQTPSPELQSALRQQHTSERLAESMVKAVAYVRQEARGPVDGLRHVVLEMVRWATQGQAAGYGTSGGGGGVGVEERRRLAASVALACKRVMLRALADTSVDNLESGFLMLASEEYRLVEVVDAVAAIATHAAARRSSSMGAAHSTAFLPSTIGRSDPFDLFASTAAAGASTALQRQGIEVLCKAPRGALASQAHLVGDSTRLLQALAALAVVAVRYAPRGTQVCVNVSILGESGAQGGGEAVSHRMMSGGNGSCVHVEFRISHAGEPIPPWLLQRMHGDPGNPAPSRHSPGAVGASHPWGGRAREGGGARELIAGGDADDDNAREGMGLSLTIAQRIMMAMGSLVQYEGSHGHSRAQGHQDYGAPQENAFVVRLPLPLAASTKSTSSSQGEAFGAAA